MSVAAVGFALLITSIFSFAFFYLMKYAFHSSSRRSSLLKPIKSTKNKSTSSVVTTKHVSRTSNKTTTLKIKKLNEAKRNVHKSDKKLKQQVTNSKITSVKSALANTHEVLPKENDELSIPKQPQPLKIVKETVAKEESMNSFVKPLNSISTKSSTNNQVPEIKQKPSVEKPIELVSKRNKTTDSSWKKFKNIDNHTQAKQKSKVTPIKLNEFDFDNFDFDDGSRLITKLIEKCDLSREQTQFVLETLLNKQQSMNMKSGGVTTEWVKPSDSSEKKLKKKLQETEIQLKHLEEQLSGANKKTCEYRTELNNQTSRIRLLESKINELQSVRSYEAKEKSAIIAELSKYKNNLTNLEDQLQKSKSTLSHHQQQSIDLLAEKDEQIKDLQLQLLEVEKRLADKIKTNSIVSDSTSVAENLCNGNLKDTVIERPAVEGQEYTPGEPDLLNDGVVVNSAEFETIKKENCLLKSRCDDLEKTLVNKEKQIKEFSNKVNELNKNVLDLDKKYQEEIKSVEAQKKSCEEKNLELRAKNFKVLEALKQTECTLEAKIKLEQDGKRRDDSKHSIKRARQLLRRQLLPQASDSDETSDKEEDDEKWSQAFANKVLRYYEKRQKCVKMNNIAVNNQHSIDQQNRHDIVSSLEQQNDKLHRMVTHYKSIISDTETMLSQLHKHVENEESRWCDQLLELQQQLDKANAELQRRKDDESSLNTTMNSSASSL